MHTIMHIIVVMNVIVTCILIHVLIITAMMQIITHIIVVTDSRAMMHIDAYSYNYCDAAYDYAYCCCYAYYCDDAY